jgi:hypothetical protein
VRDPRGGCAHDQRAALISREAQAIDFRAY